MDPRHVSRFIAFAVGIIVLAGTQNWAANSPLRSVQRPVAGLVALVEADSPADDPFIGQFCGGVAIADDLVLTAAHCVVGRAAGRVAVVADAANLCRGSSTSGSRTSVRAISIDPRYDPRTGAFDLATLRLEDKVGRTRRLSAVKGQAPDGLRATVLGWGAAGPGEPSSSCQLTQISVRIVDGAACVSALRGTSDHSFSSASMICAAPADPRADACNGNSGGPMILGSDVDHGPVVGIVSWGRGCGLFPAAYARAALAGVAGP